MLFSAEMRGKVKEENAGMSITDIAKELGVRWKSITDEEKVKYEELAKKDKVRYQEEMDAYKNKTTGAVDTGKDDDDDDDGADAKMYEEVD